MVFNTMIFRRLGFFLSISFICCASGLYSQMKSGHSIVIKFKSEASLLSPSNELRSAIGSISPQSIGSSQRIFQKKINGNIQSVNEVDPELSRIILLPLSEGVDAEESAKLISAFTAAFEYSEPTYFY